MLLPYILAGEVCWPQIVLVAIVDPLKSETSMCQFWGSDSFDEVIDVLDKRVVLGGKYFASLGVFFCCIPCSAANLALLDSVLGVMFPVYFLVHSFSPALAQYA